MPADRLIKKGDTTYLRLIWEELLGNGLGSSGLTAFGPPIENASFLISAPQAGDITAGTADGIWYPALGDFAFTMTQGQPNSLHPDAQSLVILTRMTDEVLDSDTDEDWELKNIGANATTDGQAPDFSSSSGFRGYYIGGYGAKWIVPVSIALKIIATSRWVPSPGQLQPYPNKRLIAEINQHREPVLQPVFEPSLIFPFASAGDSSSVTTPTGATIDPILMQFPADSAESDWVKLPASTEKQISVQYPAGTSANTLSFRLRSVGETGNGLPVLNSTIAIAPAGGYIADSGQGALAAFAPFLGGLHEIRGVLDQADPGSRDFYLINSGADSSTTAPPTITTLQFSISATESNWVALPNSSSKIIGIRYPEIDPTITTLSFRIRNQGDTGDGLAVVGSSLDLVATGGFGDVPAMQILVSLSPFFGGNHEVKGVLNAATPTAIAVSLLTP